MKLIFISLIFSLLLSACGTKREYFTPKSMSGKITYAQKMNSPIVDTNLYSAKLKNLEVIYEDGILPQFKLEKGYSLLSYDGGEFVSADDNGNLKIFDKDNEVIYSYKFDAAVLGVAMQGDDLALILANNTIILANRSLGIKMSQTLSEAVAQDNRVAHPYFLSKLVIFPTLDGKVVIVDKDTKRIIRDMVVSNDNFFNNIIFFQIKDDKLIAASSSKIVIFDSNNNTYSLNTEIRNVAMSEEGLFILNKDGTIIKTDFKLNKILERKFLFAIFNDANIFNETLYVFEKTGYLIKADLNLQDIQIYELKDAAKKRTFMRKDKLYYANKIVNLL